MSELFIEYLSVFAFRQVIERRVRTLHSDLLGTERGLLTSLFMYKYI